MPTRAGSSASSDRKRSRSEARTVSTNSQGRYEVRDLPAGRYTIRVTRSGYLSLELGQRRPLERGRPLQLADGQTIDSADFILPRMGVISGRVTDEVGEPIAGVTVWAFQTRYFQGRRQLVPNSGNAQTDDTGQYRITSLNPGTYTLTARLTGFNLVKREGIEVSGTTTLTIPIGLRKAA